MWATPEVQETLLDYFGITVGHLIDTLASDGTGFIVGPCHNLQAVTPVQNIVALYEAAREHGAF